LFCFFKDLDDVRQYLSEKVWARYKEGDMPLMAAATTIDLAIDTIKRR